VVFTLPVGCKENGRMLLDRLQVGQFDLVPDILGVSLVKTLDSAIAFGMADG
jgi:hypothetical protein